MGTELTYIMCVVGFTIIFGYCIFATIYNNGLPNSISQIVYALDDEWKWTFTAVMIAVAFLIAPQMMEVAGNNIEFLAYLTSVGLIGVGADPLVKDEKNIIHYVSAVIMGVASQVLVYFINPWYFALWIPYVLYTLYMEDGSKNMFLGEIVMLLATAAICLL